LLRQISRTAGIDIIIFDPIKNEDISIELIERPVEYAVKRLLKEYNHVVLFTDEGGRGEVRVLGGSQENISSSRRDQKVEASSEKVRVSGSTKSSQTNRLFAKDKSIGAKLLRKHLADAKKNEENQISTGKGM
jgi:hypothetical protein